GTVLNAHSERQIAPCPRRTGCERALRPRTHPGGPTVVGRQRGWKAAVVVGAFIGAVGVLTSGGFAVPSSGDARPHHNHHRTTSTTAASTTTSPSTTSPPTSPPTTSPSPPPVLSMRVSGSQLVDGSGAPVQLHGVNRSGPEYACAQGWGVFDGASN